MSWPELTERMDVQAHAAFGESVTYRPASGGAYEISGIWSSSYAAVDTDTGGSVSSNSPTLGVDLTAFGLIGHEPKIDDQVDARGQTYRIDDVQRDGEGAATLFLKRTA